MRKATISENLFSKKRAESQAFYKNFGLSELKNIFSRNCSTQSSHVVAEFVCGSYLKFSHLLILLIRLGDEIKSPKDAIYAQIFAELIKNQTHNPAGMLIQSYYQILKLICKTLFKLYFTHFIFYTTK